MLAVETGLRGRKMEGPFSNGSSEMSSAAGFAERSNLCLFTKRSECENGIKGNSDL